MSSNIRQNIQLLVAFFTVLLGGTAGYLYFENNWSVLDALYMTVITITTIGFGEIHNLSPAGRIFTIVLIFAGLGLAAVFVAQVAKVIVQSGIRNLYEKKKMNDRINKLEKHTIVCGYGKIGRAISLKLYELGLDFVVLDNDEEQLIEAEQRGYKILHGDAAVDGVLLSAGIRRADFIVLCINDDASNINISLAARELNPDIFVVARGTDPSIEYRMLRAGANTVVYPLDLGGEQIGHILARHAGVAEPEEKGPVAHEVMGYSLRIFPHYDSAPTTVAEVKGKTGAISALVLHRADGTDIENPSDELELNYGDSVLELVKKDGACCELQNNIKWSENLLLGIPSIDAEHRVLVRYAEDFQSALRDGQDHDAIARLFDRLLEYTSSHFAREEAFMQKRGFPEIEKHMKEHRRITREVMDLNRDKKYIFPDSIDSFLQDWIINHINNTDRQYVKYFKGDK
ncbi:bacteriohemerythrin [Maridesulfovibrio salexigens]|uniref:Hemerythrin-like metal-binding protein n=1 Tax=Maridesulfovibrio salexigens (strain ATCC 14822 / DSM 2638 / NCIMB 8403 / VKM B-1763) TaxID=526222 RepID=C6BUJ6_MARSD|nr:bacteriohemerythrin [Maridesulfovibrio salexigens]ACS80005.1 hemerythrin-like metal-binding protein [Maridesulfovibrio salexigens DSM 2638]